MNASCLRSFVRDASLLQANDCGYRIDERQCARDIKRDVRPAQRGEPVTLTLCGERHARTWTTAPASAFARLGRSIQQLFGTAPIGDTLKDL